MFDAKGNQVYNKNNITIVGNVMTQKIDMSSMRSGVYFLRVNYRDYSKLVRKIIKI